jgi:hypothetical protein
MKGDAVGGARSTQGREYKYVHRFNQKPEAMRLLQNGRKVLKLIGRIVH